jgi:hypothetical protein
MKNRLMDRQTSRQDIKAKRDEETAIKRRY